MKGGLCDKEICRRIAMDKAAMGGLTTIWKDSGIRLATKVKSVKGLVFSIHTLVVLYEADTRRAEMGKVVDLRYGAGHK